MVMVNNKKNIYSSDEIYLLVSLTCNETYPVRVLTSKQVLLLGLLGFSILCHNQITYGSDTGVVRLW